MLVGALCLCAAGVLAQRRDVFVASRDHPAIAYRPSCAICNYPGEREYRAVFAYAYVPHPQEHTDGLLACGLRSTPVVMPPLAVSHPAAK